MIKNINELAYLYVTGKASAAEKERLESMMQENAVLKDKITALLQRSDLAEAWDIFQSVDDSQAFDSLQKKISPNIYNKVYRKNAISAGFFSFFTKSRIAAVIIAVAIVSALTVWYNDYTHVTLPDTPVHPIGELFEYEASPEEIENAKSACVAMRTPVNKEGLNEFHLDAATAESMLSADNITTTNNKDYWVTLPDGTSVHLGGNSRIIYPAHFPKATPWNPHPVREVVLRGKAYFMVAKDKSRKFVVHTAHGDIIDYGTEFFVSTPEDTANENMRVVLTKGKVGVKSASIEEKMLAPGEEASISADGIRIQDVDITPYTTWNTSTLSFEAYTLEKIMDIVSVWYDLEVEYESDKLRTMKIDGVLSRYEPLDNLIKSINLIASLKITHDGDKIKVKK